MVQRDLKIGLILGLILVFGIIIKLVTDPDLSTESRMAELQNTAMTESASNNELDDEFVIEENPSEQIDVPVIERTIDMSAQNEQLENLFAHETTPQDRIKQPVAIEQIKEEPAENEIIPTVDSTDKLLAAHESENSFNKNNITENSQIANSHEIPEEQESFDYENAEVIKTERFHIIRKNETLSEISSLYYHSSAKWQIIVDANPDVIKDPNKIKAGMKLIIPKI